jgi:predicted helicase
MTLAQYLTKLNTLYITGNAREHSYRGDLQTLLETLLPGVLVTNEPARVACGAPDYVLTRKDVPVGYIEAKDIGVDLNSKTLKEQFDRYRAGLPNIVFTDYLDFHFYKDGQLTAKVKIGHIEQGKIVPNPEGFEQFTHLMQNFAETITQTIKSPTRLAELMAGRAKLMAEVIEVSLNTDDARGTHSNLKTQMESFKDMLIHDIDNKAFADIYAQTIAYGMFAARYHDPTLPTFSREEAATLIPKSNPFLRKLFQDIAGYDLDGRLVWIVEELVRIFLATDVAGIMKNFGRSTRQEDPVVHFYETFLASYSPALRKARGVWYTPQPVVNFIVRAVDDILKDEFGLKDGLADTSKTKIKVPAPKLDERSKNKSKVIGEKFIDKEVHKVQILDPATGTGTFLAEVVRHIHKKFEGQQGIWSRYVNKDLIPRLNGFELLMASYAMAHLKMDMLLTETGYKPTDDQRFRIFLTNSLEEHHKDTGSLFSHWLADEANQANALKRDAPVMVVIGNPPYSVSSTNKSPWIENLVADYKKDLKERNIQPLSDDYIKFIRFGQHFIDKNGEGILAYISNNSFIDGIIHRQMRKHLAESFDKIYILDLHGNSKKKETAPDGSADQNVFDIMQGVSINIFIKNNNNDSGLADVYNWNLVGKRKDKYNILNESSFLKIDWKKVNLRTDNYLFATQDGKLHEEFEKLINLNTLFRIGSNGVQTKRDDLFVDFQKNNLTERMNILLSGKVDKTFSDRYKIEDSSSYPLLRRIENNTFKSNLITDILYRPLDNRKIYYDKDLLGRPFYKVLKQLLNKPNNYCIVLGRQGQAVGNGQWNLVSISNKIIDTNLFYRGGNMALPLYLYPEETGQLTTDGAPQREPNLDPKIVQQIAAGLGLTFVPEKALRQAQGDTPGSHAEPVEAYVMSTAAQPPVMSTGAQRSGDISNKDNTFAPIDLLDYIYAVLHSPAYREKYKEFLKIDFPRVPYPAPPGLPEGEEKEAARKRFWQLVKLGAELRQIHLLESQVVEQYITQYPIDGDNVVGKIYYEEGRVYINYDKASPLEIEGLQYFSGVPQVAWNFYIGGYQPAQKWLKDRKGRELSYEDIFHYQKIIVALTETDRIMKEIDVVGVE